MVKKQTAKITYLGQRPNSKEIGEILEWLPHLEIKLELYQGKLIKTTTDKFYGFKTLDFDWLRELFKNEDVQCFLLPLTMLRKVGVGKHYGFYSLDENLKHQLYITDINKSLDRRAKLNGFKTNLAWLFVHEYLHGSVWGATRDRYRAAQDVHDHEARGELKRLAEEDYQRHQGTFKTLTNLIKSWYNHLNGKR